MPTTSSRKKSSSTKRLPDRFSHVLVRHASLGNRGDFDRTASMISCGFDKSSTSSSESSIAGTNAYAERWVVVGEFKSEPWISLFTSELLESLFDANASARRLEVLMLRREGSALTFLATKQRKPLVEFRGPIDGVAEKLTCSNAALQETLQSCETGLQIFETLCEHFEVTFPLHKVEVVDGSFAVIGKTGKAVKTGMLSYKLHSASGLAPGEDPAADLMEKALDKVSPKLLREALDAGAPIDKLPDRSTTPLFAALCKWGRKPEWKACAETLIEAGADVNEVSRHGEPLLELCCGHLFSDDHSVALIEFLSGHGVDVNQTGNNNSHVLNSPSLRANVPKVVALMKAGADPTLAFVHHANGASLIDELKERLQKELKYRSNSKYVAVLEALGEQVALPEQEPLTPELIRENERFADVMLANQLEKVLAIDFTVRTFKESRLGKYPEYRQWSQQLKELGFEESANMISQGADQMTQSAFTDPNRNYDVMITDSGIFAPPLIRLEMVAYHPSGPNSCVVRDPVVANPRIPTRVFDRKVVQDGSPADLVAALDEMTAGKSIEPLTVAGFVERYEAVCDQAFDDFRLYVDEIRKEWIVRDDGTTPRFERMGRYVELPNAEEDPNYSSRRRTENLLRSMRNAGDWDDAAKDVVSDAAHLMINQHLQYAGAATGDQYLEFSLQKSVELFELFSEKPKLFDYFWGCDYLPVAWILAWSNDDHDAFAKICETLKPGFASEKRWNRGDIPVEVAQVQLLIAQYFRTKAIRGAKAFPESINSGGSARGKSTLKVWQAIEKKDSASFEKQFTKLLKATSKSNQKKLDGRSGGFEIQLAWMESVLWILARKAGLEMPELSEELMDWLVTPESLASEA